MMMIDMAMACMLFRRLELYTLLRICRSVKIVRRKIRAVPWRKGLSMCISVAISRIFYQRRTNSQ